jgi:hypothetical protein
VEPVLDFLEDVGMQLARNQISDELAHHYFFPTIQTYYLALGDYIREKQKSDKTTWEYIEPLYERTFLIERRKDEDAEKYPSKEKLIELLKLDAEKPPQI